MSSVIASYCKWYGRGFATRVHEHSLACSSPVDESQLAPLRREMKRRPLPARGLRPPGTRHSGAPCSTVLGRGRRGAPCRAAIGGRTAGHRRVWTLNRRRARRRGPVPRVVGLCRCAVHGSSPTLPLPSLTAPQELHHPQRVSALDRVSGAAAAVEAGPVVYVLLHVAAVTEALPGAKARRRDRPADRRKCRKNNHWETPTGIKD